MIYLPNHNQPLHEESYSRPQVISQAFCLVPRRYGGSFAGDQHKFLLHSLSNEKEDSNSQLTDCIVLYSLSRKSLLLMSSPYFLRNLVNSSVSGHGSRLIMVRCSVWFDSWIAMIDSRGAISAQHKNGNMFTIPSSQKPNQPNIVGVLPGVAKDKDAARGGDDRWKCDYRGQVVLSPPAKPMNLVRSLSKKPVTKTQFVYPHNTLMHKANGSGQHPWNNFQDACHVLAGTKP
jgi:hypothetical protein